MKRVLLSLALVLVAITSFADKGDVTPINQSQIIEIRQEQTVIAETGKVKTEIVVIYLDNAGHRKLAYMTAADYKKLEKAEKYNVYVEYELVEMSNSKMKLSVK